MRVCVTHYETFPGHGSFILIQLPRLGQCSWTRPGYAASERRGASARPAGPSWPSRSAARPAPAPGKQKHCWPSGRSVLAEGQQCDRPGPIGPRPAGLSRTAAKQSLATEQNSRSPQDKTGELANSDSCGLVRGFVLRDDVRRNAPALIDLVSALLRPLPDLSAALTAGAGARPAPPCRRACFARVLDIVGKFFTKLARVARTQIDLIRGAVESKRHGLCSLASIEIVDEKHLYLLCHDSALLTEQRISDVKDIPNLLALTIPELTTPPDFRHRRRSAGAVTLRNQTFVASSASARRRSASRRYWIARLSRRHA
jgi:hypothetical protein